MSGRLWKWLETGSFIAAFIFLIATISLVPLQGWGKSAVLAALAALALGLYANRKSRRRDESGRLAAERQRMLQMIGRYRHDWMNDLQVLFGYIQLNKREKINAHIVTITDKLHREGLVGKLGILELSAFLLSFREESQRMELIVRPEREISLAAMGKTGALAADVLIAMVRAYDEAAATGSGEVGHLLVTIDVLERELLLLFEYSGFYNEAVLRKRSDPVLAGLKGGGGAAIECDFRKEAADFEVRLTVDGWSEP